MQLSQQVALVLLVAVGSTSAFSVAPGRPLSPARPARKPPTINMAGWNDPYDTQSGKGERLKTEKDAFDDKLAAQGASMNNSLLVVSAVFVVAFLGILSQVL